MADDLPRDRGRPGSVLNPRSPIFTPDSSLQTAIRVPSTLTLNARSPEFIPSHDAIQTPRLTAGMFQSSDIVPPNGKCIRQSTE